MPDPRQQQACTCTFPGCTEKAQWLSDRPLCEGHRYYRGEPATPRMRYRPIETAPENELVLVCWGTIPPFAYGMAKFACGRWWDYTLRNPYAQGYACGVPTGWHPLT